MLMKSLPEQADRTGRVRTLQVLLGELAGRLGLLREHDQLVAGLPLQTVVELEQAHHLLAVLLL